jgi:hypothetical protein
MTLAEFVREEWWPRYAVPNLKPSTQRRYLEVWGTHLLPILGDYEQRAITPMLVEDVRAQLAAAYAGLRPEEATAATWGELARPYAGVLDELEDEPRTPAAEAVNAARNQLSCAQNVRTEQMGEDPLAGEPPAAAVVGDTGLEPVTSALSRRRSPS